MKAYITCPISHTKERLNLLPEIEKITKSEGIVVYPEQEVFGGLEEEKE